MTTKNDIGDTVLNKVKVDSIENKEYGVRYVLSKPATRIFREREENIPSKLTDGGIHIDPYLKSTNTDAEDLRDDDDI